MYYGNIKNVDVADGPGVRVTLFVSGCTHGCKGCFQPETWDFKYGKLYTQDTEETIIEMLRPGYIKGLTLLGGEPMEPDNQRELINLVRKVKFMFPDKDIWCYTGYTYEKDLVEGGAAYTEVTEKLLKRIDVLVDGEFVEEKRNLMLRFRGSENQRLIDLNKSTPENIVLWEE